MGDDVGAFRVVGVGGGVEQGQGLVLQGVAEVLVHYHHAVDLERVRPEAVAEQIEHGAGGGEDLLEVAPLARGKGVTDGHRRAGGPVLVEVEVADGQADQVAGRWVASLEAPGGGARSGAGDRGGAHADGDDLKRIGDGDGQPVPGLVGGVVVDR